LLHAKGKMSLRKSHREGLDLLAECSDIKSMSNTYRISGQTSFLANLMRGLFLAVAAIGGVFMLAFSAAFAFFVVAGLAIVGLVVFAFFWTRAKLFGKPFGPKAQFEAARRDMLKPREEIWKLSFKVWIWIWSITARTPAPLSMPIKHLKVGPSTISLRYFYPNIYLNFCTPLLLLRVGRLAWN